MTTKAQYKIMTRDLYGKLETLMGKEELLDWWQRNIIALNDIIIWDYQLLYSVLNQEYQCLMHLYDQIFKHQCIDDIAADADWREQARDERPQ